jgi:hypothetical protein
MTLSCYQERLRYLVVCGLSARLEALPFNIWRDCISNMIQTANFIWTIDNSFILREIRAKFDHFEDELSQLKQVTTILEIALWKMKMNEKSHQDLTTQSQKKIKTDKSSSRQQYRVTCGADVVIGYVVPFLITA